jgi:sialic acid synthase SpsE
MEETATVVRLMEDTSNKNVTTVKGVMKYPAPMSGSNLKRLLAKVVSENNESIRV